jgi:hypothetical protein
MTPHAPWRRAVRCLLLAAALAPGACTEAKPTPIPADTATDIAGADLAPGDVATPDQVTPDVPAVDPGPVSDPGHDPGKADTHGPDPGGGGQCVQAACPPAHTCAGGVCVKECEDGPPVAELVAALGPGVVPVSQFCTDNSRSWGWEVLATFELLELLGESGPNTSKLTLERWPLWTPSGPEEATVVATQPAGGSIDLWEVLPGAYLAVDALSQRVAWGYTTTFGTYKGQVFVTPLAGGAPTTIQAPGNYSAALFGGFAFISGFGAGILELGPGMYAADLAGGSGGKVAQDIGETVGALAVHEDVLLVGGYSDAWAPCEVPDPANPPPPEAGHRVFVLSAGQAAGAFIGGGLMAARCSVQELPLAPDFRFLDDGRIATRETGAGFGTTGLAVHRWQPGPDGEVVLSGADTIASGPLFTGLRGLAGSELLVLRHDHGYLLVDGPPRMVAPQPDPDAGPEPMPEAAPEPAVELGPEPAADSGGQAEVVPAVDAGLGEFAR